MDLLPEELRKTLPPLYSQESSSAPVVHAQTLHPRCWVDVADYGGLGARGMETGSCSDM